ncbi:MAG: TolB family protein [Oligoflexales bacterium]
MHRNSLSRFYLILLLIVTACDESSTSKEDPQEPERRGQTVNPVEFGLLDIDPSISADGSKIVFLSGRDDILKAYKFESGGTEPSRLTDVDLGSEGKAELSPDGKWVLLTVTSEGSSQLYAQSFTDAAVRTLVDEEEGSWDFAPSVSPGANPLIVFKKKSEEEGRIFDLVSSKITDGGTSVTVSDSVAVPGTTVGEDFARFRTVNSGYELITVQHDVDTNAFVSRGVSSGTVSSTFSEIATDLSGIRPAHFDVGGTQLFTAVHLNDRKELDVVLTEGDEVEINTQEQVKSFDFSGGGNNELDLPVIGVQDISVARDTDNALVLGQEYFSCPNYVGWGSVISLWDPANSGFVKLLLVKTDVGWNLQSDPCSGFEEGAEKQPVNTQISKIRLANTAGSGFNVVLQTWYKGDPEILHLRFGWDGSKLTNRAVTDVSQN